MTARRASALVALAAVLCLLLGAFGSNAAAGTGKVQLSVGGRGFSAAPAGPLVDTSGLAPGRTVAATLGVRSKFRVPTGLSLQLTGVHDDDNGCAAAEARVDGTCGTGQGELGHALVATIAAAAGEHGSYRVVWQGPAERLVAGASVGLTVPARSDRWLRVTLAVPAGIGNVVESDTFTFGLRVVLQGNGADGGSGVAGVQTGGDPGAGSSGASGGGSGTAGLAATGFSTVLFLGGGVLLVIAGAMLLSAARADRRRGVQR